MAAMAAYARRFKFICVFYIYIAFGLCFQAASTESELGINVLNRSVDTRSTARSLSSIRRITKREVNFRSSDNSTGGTGAIVNSTDGDTFPVILNNQTLAEHNIYKTENDYHTYYNSTFIQDENVSNALWVDMSNRSDVTVSEMLSKSHRRATTVRLSFDFPFYGHIVGKVTIATGGFLYTGDYIHSWLATTQYIAPLMANFDNSISNTSFVKYIDNGTAFTVQWEQVVLQNNRDNGSFSFQTTLHNNGDIVFVYQSVPIPIDKIDDVKHPVKVGLSDAYVIDHSVFYMTRKTIYEYHRLPLSKEIRSGTVIYLYALPTCVALKDCHTCLSQSIGFVCQWCQSAKRCSDGMDRYRQNWTMQDCHSNNLTLADQCPPVTVSPVSPTSFVTRPPTSSVTREQANLEVHTDQIAKSEEHTEQPMNADEHISGTGVGTILMFLITGIVVVVFVMWFTYAYRNPHTFSGQILIKYRPSQLQWRRGEARYTAATIHM